MTSTKTARGDALPARRAPGIPFRVGPDPRRHMEGRKSKRVIEVSQALKNALAEEGRRGGNVRKLAAMIWRRAQAGHPWAVELIFDRLLGRAPQAISAEFEVRPQAVFIMSRPGAKPQAEAFPAEREEGTNG